jgi:transcriptional regulator with XRE-family HTH domain
MATNIRLRTARVAKGMTQLQLATAVAVKEIDISRYETGRAQPDPETKRRLAEALGRPSYELFNS